MLEEGITDAEAGGLIESASGPHKEHQHNGKGESKKPINCLAICMS